MSRQLTAHYLPWLALAGVVALSLGQVLSAERRLSHTVDEPVHIASGLEWWLRGTQLLHPENPPLGRLGAGLHAYLAGDELPSTGRAPERGVQILYGGTDYLDELVGARRGTVPFYLLLLLVVGCWSARLGGLTAAAIAVAAVAGLPPLVAHASLATTDVPATATLLLAIWGLAIWLDRHRATGRSDGWVGTAIFAGVAAGLALSSKFSALLFLPAALTAMGLLRWVARRRTRPGAASGRRRSVVGPLVAILCAGLVLWGLYGFDVGRASETGDIDVLIDGAFPNATSPAHRLAAFLTGRRLPAPGALRGILLLAMHTRLGHPAYLFGEVSQHGFWYFYPVALLFKTPLLFLLLTAAGLAAALRWRGDWRQLAPAAAALGILAASLTSTINIGIRHVLIVYPLVAVTAAAGLAGWLERLRGRRRQLAVALTVGVLAGQTATCVASHPDQLAYFNPLAGREPGRILIDSDLDWGQSLLELSARLEELGVSRLHIAFFGSASLCDHGLPAATWLPPHRPVRRWVAVSEMYYRGQWRRSYDAICPKRGARAFEDRDGYAWLARYEPIERIGGSIRLYRIPDR